jgi:hypothetical protein
MKRAKATHDEPLKLDMDFNEALGRLAQTNPAEVDRAIAEDEQDGPVRLVSADDTGDNFLVYGTDKGFRVDLRFSGRTFWATQKQMAQIFGVTRENITTHLSNIFREGELMETAVCKESLLPAADGKNYKTKLYNLNALISVGYRVGSKEGTMFRIWATDKLIQILTKGFYVDVERLKAPNQEYNRVAELREIVRDIRASEANIYREVRQLCTMCRDYDPKSREWQNFFARMQNKIFWATVQAVATQIRIDRANAERPNMGLTAWASDRIRQSDTLIAKNYLGEDEGQRMNRLTVMLLDFIEDQLKEERIALMAELETALDGFVKNTGRTLLPRGVRIPTKTQADEHCKAVFKIFAKKRALSEGEPDTKGLADFRSE